MTEHCPYIILAVAVIVLPLTLSLVAWHRQRIRTRPPPIVRTRGKIVGKRR